MKTMEQEKGAREQVLAAYKNLAAMKYEDDPRNKRFYVMWKMKTDYLLLNDINM